MSPRSRHEHHQPLKSHSNIEVIGLARIDSIPSINSDATIDNQPGAGRTVGRFLAWLGLRLERSLNNRAKRLGLGPSAVATEIRRRTGYYENVAIETSPMRPKRELSESEERAIRKLCYKLFGYARSHIIENQYAALDEITNLAIDDPLVRKILASCDLNRLITHYAEPNLILAIRGALGAVEFSNVHRIWAPILSLHPVKAATDGRDSREDYITSLKEGIFETLRNPSTSFLAARYYERAIKKIYTEVECNDRLLRSLERLLCNFGDLYTRIAVQRPEDIEWPTFNACVTPFSGARRRPPKAGDEISIGAYRLLIRSRNLDALDLIQRFSSILIRIFCPPNFLLQDKTFNISSRDPEWFGLGSDLKGLYDFISYITKSSDYRAHFSSVDQISKIARIHLPGTVFTSRVRLTYYILICHTTKRHAFQSIKDDTMTHMCNHLVSYLKLNSPREVLLANSLVTRFCSINRYCKLAAFRAAQEISIPIYNSIVDEFTKARETNYANKSQKGLPFEFIRVRLPSPGTSRIFEYISRYNIENYVRNQMVQGEDYFVCEIMRTGGHAIYIDVDGDEEPFHATGHYPIIAHLPKEKFAEPLYIAQVLADDFLQYCTCVADGSSSVTYTTLLTDVTATSTKFQVLCLRHDPMDYRGHSLNEGGLVDQVGPLGWRTFYEGSNVEYLRELLL